MKTFYQTTKGKKMTETCSLCGVNRSSKPIVVLLTTAKGRMLVRQYCEDCYERHREEIDSMAKTCEVMKGKNLIFVPPVHTKKATWGLTEGETFQSYDAGFRGD